MIESHHLVSTLAWEACRAFSPFEFHPFDHSPRLSVPRFHAVELAVRALGNYRLALIDDDYDSFESYVDGLEWVTLKRCGSWMRLGTT